jgi:hypothetical protein
MATEKEANKARNLHSDMLQSLGVHSIGVDVIGKKDSKKFGIVAYVEKHVKDLPSELTILSGKKEIKVPVISQLADQFKPESL